MKILGMTVVLTLVCLLAAMGWQHLRYQKARRGPVQDRQDAFYPSSTFHVLTFVRIAEGGSVIESLRKLREGLEGNGAARMVYAGQVATVALASAQLPATDWDAVVLVQYPSRDAYDALAASASYRSALDAFPEHYSHGMDRSVALNLLIPQMLLGLRAKQIVTRAPSHYPFVPAAAEDRVALTTGREDRFARLDALRSLSENALVIVNLLKGGTREQQASDRAYGLKMAGAFAEGGHGPMHIGKAVTLEGNAEFDRIALVYYPGIDYMQSLMGSTFFNGIAAGKQPGDTLAAATVPLLSRL